MPTRTPPLRPLVVLALAMALPGCATLTRGVHQDVAIDTPEASGARCVVTDARGTIVAGAIVADVVTPGHARLRKGRKPLEVSCTRAGFAPASATLVPRMDRRARFQGPPGLLVDAISGAMWSFPDVLRLPMHRLHDNTSAPDAQSGLDAGLPVSPPPR